MGFTGLIYVAIALAWLVYFVPVVLRNKDAGIIDEPEPEEPFTPSVTIVRRGVPLDVAEETVQVWTPLNRRAALRELDLADARAAFRRRVVLGVLLGAASVLGVLAGLRLVHWGFAAVPMVLLAAFVGVARVTVVRMRDEFEARAALIRATAPAELTVAIPVLADEADAGHEQTVDLTAPIQAVSSLWDPVPITKATYVSRPLAARTVRTIDLSAPSVAASGGIPVTADPLPERVEPDAGDEGDEGDEGDAGDPRAANE